MVYGTGDGRHSVDVVGRTDCPIVTGGPDFPPRLTIRLREDGIMLTCIANDLIVDSFPITLTHPTVHVLHPPTMATFAGHPCWLDQ